MIRPVLWAAALLAAAPGWAAERGVRYADSEIGFNVRQMGVRVSGVFRDFRALVRLDPGGGADSGARVDVNVASIDTGVADADTEALKRPWLSAARHPRATFRSDAVTVLGGGRYRAAGTLTLRGVRQAVAFPFTTEDRPDGSTVVRGDFTIRRTDFGIGGGRWNEGDLVADEIAIRFRITLEPPRQAHRSSP